MNRYDFPQASGQDTASVMDDCLIGDAVTI